jgi:FkbM family methyltransferase
VELEDGQARSVARVSDAAAQSWFECGDFHFFCRNRDEFARICQDVFRHHEYAFQTRRWTPLIIDAGAHVGAATHYFKRRYPRARVLAIEANPTTFALLERNIARNRLTRVRAMQAALAATSGEIPFYTSGSDEEPGAWGDSAIPQPWHEHDDTAIVRVPAVTLSSLLTEPVDMLKLDIEGSETEVLTEAAPQLTLVRHVSLEFHGTTRNPANSVARICDILAAAGLTPEVKQYGRVVKLSEIERTDPYWLMVRAERLNPLRRLRRVVGG